MTLVHIASFFN